MKKIIAQNKLETKKIAQKLAGQLRGGEILALQGDLGAGKTFLTQQIAKYFKIKSVVTSPTFVLMKIYNIRIKNKEIRIKYLVHVDCYRLDEPQELFYLGLEEYLNQPDTLVIIEWADKIKSYLKKFKRVSWIKIKVKQKQRIFQIK